MKLQKIGLALALGLAVQSVSAHGAWLAQRVDSQTIVYGHGADDNAYKADKVTYTQAFDAEGKAIDVTTDKNAHNVSFPKDATFTSAAFIMDNGYWSKDKDGKWTNKPKNEVDNVEKSVHSIKTGLGVVDHGKLPSLDALGKLDLVLYPESELEHVKAGDEVKVTVYYKGKPLADAEIVADYMNDGDKVTTDKDGKASIKVRNNGMNVLAVSHKIDTEGDEKAKADSLSYTATLSFVAGEHHEH